jgi:transposase
MDMERRLTDEQWEILEPLIPDSTQRADKRGAPPTERRALLDGILWILWTGAGWADLPRCYPPKSTVHRWFQRWVDEGVFERIVTRLAGDLYALGDLEVAECFIDGTFAPAKKGGDAVGKTKRGKGTKIMGIADAHGLPVSILVASATPHEVTLAEATVAARVVEEVPEHLIGDKAYDSDKLDAGLAAMGVEMIAPHRRNRQEPTQDGRALRRYQRRWKVERLWAWLQNYRRIVVRYEFYPQNFLGFVHFGCALILLRQLF